MPAALCIRSAWVYTSISSYHGRNTKIICTHHPTWSLSHPLLPPSRCNKRTHTHCVLGTWSATKLTFAISSYKLCTTNILCTAPWSFTKQNNTAFSRYAHIAHTYCMYHSHLHVHVNGVYSISGTRANIHLHCYTILYWTCGTVCTGGKDSEVTV